MIYYDKEIPSDFQVPGFSWSGIPCGIKDSGQPDLALIFSEVSCTGVGLFTTNVFKAAPVELTRKQLANGRAQAVIINSGNANAATGPQGMQAAASMADLAAARLRVAPGVVLVCSTGRIGLPLPMGKIRAGMARLASSLSPLGYKAAAEAIMTTDQYPKLAAGRLTLGGKRASFLAVAKGAGMIRPDMATMLSFTVTDLKVSREVLKRSFKAAVDASYNCITVDGQQSTNDTVLIMANGLAGNRPLKRPEELDRLSRLLARMHLALAKSIVRDGEGASKLLYIRVAGAASAAQAKRAAYAVGDSSLVKAAFFGEQLNWGRIVSAIGAAGIKIVPEKVDVWIGGRKVVRGGVAVSRERERQAAVALKQDEVELIVNLNIADDEACVYASDLTYDYVSLNAGHE